MIDATPVRDLYHAFVSGDFEALGSTLSDDALLGVAGRSRFTGHHQGGDAVVSVFRGMAELRPKLPEAWDVCVSEHHAVLLDWFEADRMAGSSWGTWPSCAP